MTLLNLCRYSRILLTGQIQSFPVWDIGLMQIGTRINLMA